MSQPTNPETALLRRWVETWRRAGVELEALRRIEIESVDTREAVRQIFGTADVAVPPPALPTSGLVEQQAWFERVRRARHEP